MTPAAFDYVRARSVEDALRLLREHDDAKLLAGGHSLIPMMKLRLATPRVLVDIAEIAALREVVSDARETRLGALVTHATLASSELVQRLGPALSDAARVLGDPQVRNRGTVGGACAHGDPAADYPAVMLALDATFTLVGPAGRRDVRADEFFTGMFETALAPDEILTEIAFAAANRSAYEKFPHPASGYAVVGAAAAVEIADRRIAAARIAVSGVGDAHFRAKNVEESLRGVAIDDSGAIASACIGAATEVEARGDAFASGEYRAAMADVYVRRAVTSALARG